MRGKHSIIKLEAGTVTVTLRKWAGSYKGGIGRNNNILQKIVSIQYPEKFVEIHNGDSKIFL